MTGSRSLTGLSLKVSPLGETDRLLTLLSNEEGLTRLAVPGARRPKGHLAAATPLSLLKLDIVGRKGLHRVRQLEILKNFNLLGQKLESLAGAQALLEITLMIVTVGDPIPGLLNTILLHLKRLEALSKNKSTDYSLTTLAITVQACTHLLALGGYGLPLQKCCVNGEVLNPPIGEWEWRCSLLPDDGFAIGSKSNSAVELNPSELALLQRLLQPDLPLKGNGDLLGPKEVWLKLLAVVEFWTNRHLPKNLHALRMLRDSLTTK